MNSKLFIPVVAVVLFFSGCGSGSNVAETSISDGFHRYAVGEVALNIPNDWDVLTKEQLPGNLSKNTIVAFRNNVKNTVFTATALVVENNLGEESNSLGYAKALFRRASTELANFKEIGREQVQIKIGSVSVETQFVIYDGKESPSAETKEFMHLGAVKGMKAYSMLGAMRTNEDQGVKEMVEKMVKSFEVK